MGWIHWTGASYNRVAALLKTGPVTGTTHGTCGVWGVYSTSSTRAMRAWMCNTGSRLGCWASEVAEASCLNKTFCNKKHRYHSDIESCILYIYMYTHTQLISIKQPILSMSCLTPNTCRRLPNDQIRIPLTINFPEVQTYPSPNILSIPIPYCSSIISIFYSIWWSRMMSCNVSCDMFLESLVEQDIGWPLCALTDQSWICLVTCRAPLNARVNRLELPNPRSPLLVWSTRLGCWKSVCLAKLQKRHSSCC